VATHCLWPSSQQSATGRSFEPDKSDIRFTTLIYLKYNLFYCLLCLCLPSSHFLSGFPVTHLRMFSHPRVPYVCLLKPALVAYTLLYFETNIICNLLIPSTFFKELNITISKKLSRTSLFILGLIRVRLVSYEVAPVPFPSVFPLLLTIPPLLHHPPPIAV
jgi:hypothetical protein